MATISSRLTAKGYKRWRVQIRTNGRPYKSKTFVKKSDAVRWTADYERQISGAARCAGPAHTVGELIDRYCEVICPTTKTGYRKTQQLHAWRVYLGGLALDVVRPADIAFARDMIAKGRLGGTVVNYLAALSHAFTIALKDWQWIEVNPVKLITWPRPGRGRVRFLSPDERARLLAACQRSGCAALADIVALAILTGMRKGEILGLKGAAVDMTRKRIILTETKNNERRRVPLVPAALAVVARYVTESNAHLFHRPRHPLEPLDIRYPWQSALIKSGVDDFRFHDLRHTAASYLAMSGATTNEIAEILGHKTLSMVKRYAHLTTGHSASVLERMADSLETDDSSL